MIDPNYTEQLFSYSFDAVNYNHNPPKLKTMKMDDKNFSRVAKVFGCLCKLTGLLWREVPNSDLLYCGSQANPIKEVADEGVRRVLENAFSKNESDYSSGANFYPSYLAIAKEIRLFGYQWKGVFNIVLMDLNHEVLKRK